jgi:hypothetical protein
MVRIEHGESFQVSALDGDELVIGSPMPSRLREIQAFRETVVIDNSGKATPILDDRQQVPGCSEEVLSLRVEHFRWPFLGHDRKEAIGQGDVERTLWWYSVLLEREEVRGVSHTAEDLLPEPQRDQFNHQSS